MSLERVGVLSQKYQIALNRYNQAQATKARLLAELQKAEDDEIEAFQNLEQTLDELKGATRESIPPARPSRSDISKR